MTVILAIDPGTIESGWCLYCDEGRVLDSGIKLNDILAIEIRSTYADELAIERIASYGMSVGRDVFETCEWVGEFRGLWRLRYKSALLVYRKDVKLYLCGSPKAKDANIRQSLIDMFGGKEKAIGRKATPGPLHGVKSHAWSALAVAIVAAHQMKEAA